MLSSPMSHSSVNACAVTEQPSEQPTHQPTNQPRPSGQPSRLPSSQVQLFQISSSMPWYHSSPSDNVYSLLYNIYALLSLIILLIHYAYSVYVFVDDVAFMSTHSTTYITPFNTIRSTYPTTIKTAQHSTQCAAFQTTNNATHW